MIDKIEKRGRKREEILLAIKIISYGENQDWTISLDIHKGGKVSFDIPPDFAKELRKAFEIAEENELFGIEVSSYEFCLDEKDIEDLYQALQGGFKHSKKLRDSSLEKKAVTSEKKEED